MQKIQVTELDILYLCIIFFSILFFIFLFNRYLSKVEGFHAQIRIQRIYIKTRLYITYVSLFFDNLFRVAFMLYIWDILGSEVSLGFFIFLLVINIFYTTCKLWKAQERALLELDNLGVPTIFQRS